MAKVQRSTDLIEIISEQAVFCLFGGAGFMFLAFLLLRYRGDGIFVPLGWVLFIFGLALAGTAIVCTFKAKKVTGIGVKCPFCGVENGLLEPPEEDFACVGCHRMIPILDGEVMPVQQVQCGFCKTLNWYCEKTEVLICENCDREIPIAQEDDRPTKSIPKGYTIVDDDSLYELVLSEAGTKNEEVISVLQHMLALNRNQVKDILDQLPSTLLTGINRRKAEMLQAQLAVHGASADIRELSV